MRDIEAIKEELSDRKRMAEIARLGIHIPRKDLFLHSLVEQAAREMGTPISLISIILGHAQLFFAATGLAGWVKETQGTPIEWSFSLHSVETKEPFVVHNATLNPLVKDNPMVILEGIRCYAGVPMVTRNGHMLGNFCVLGYEERNFDPSEVSKLGTYAQQAMEYLEEVALAKENPVS